MGRMALRKLERRMDQSVNTQPRGVVGKRLQTRGFLPNQVLSGPGAINMYLFYMKLAESPEYSNCSRSGRDDDA